MATFPEPEISGATAVVQRPVETLAAIYDYRDEEAVLAYLHTHADLVEILVERLPRMRQDWWLDLYRHLGGRRNLDVEFQ